MFSTRLGLVRLNMSQPFSLRVGGVVRREGRGVVGGEGVCEGGRGKRVWQEGEGNGRCWIALQCLGESPSSPLQEYITSGVIFDSPWQVQPKSYSEEEGRKRKLVSALAHHVVHGE